MTVDYSVLEGREIKHNSRKGIVYPGVVAGCDFDIGITIVDKYNNNRPLLCLNGHYRCRVYSNVEYTRIFDFVVTQIRDGVSDSKTLDEFHIKLMGFPAWQNPTKEDCPFY